jgi:hypothetical protein
MVKRSQTIINNEYMQNQRTSQKIRTLLALPPFLFALAASASCLWVVGYSCLPGDKPSAKRNGCLGYISTGGTCSGTTINFNEAAGYYNTYPPVQSNCQWEYVQKTVKSAVLWNYCGNPTTILNSGNDECDTGESGYNSCP